MSELSVMKKAEWLKTVLASPHSLSDKERTRAIEICKSQAALAKFNSDEKNIRGCSLNTLKSHAESRLEEGFLEMDRLRKSVLSVLTEVKSRNKDPKRGTISFYLEKNKDQKEEIQRLTDEIQLITVKLNDVLSFANTLAKQANQEASYNKMYHEVFSKFTIRS